jgi:hypothetical protein
MTGQQNITIRKMIRTYGQTVQRKRRVRTIDSNGDYTYSYELMEPITGQFTQLTATDESAMHWGFAVDADYIATFLPNSDVKEGDIYYLDDGWREVQNFVARSTKGRIDFIEALLRTKEIL